MITLFLKKRQAMCSLVLLPILFLLTLVMPTPRVHAADVSNNVTSLTVSPQEISDGGKTTVRFTFDEHAQKIQAGDTITVSWQNSGTVYGSGFQKNIRLTIGDVYVGDMVVSDGQAKVTFNDGITGLQNITGWGEFEILGRDITQTSQEHSGNFTITSGGQSTSVRVTKGASGVVGVFYYKTGDMQPNDTDHVRWFLNINNEKAYVQGDIRIEDQIQPGQTLDMNSFEIDVAGTRNKNYYGATVIADFLKDFPGSTLSADPNTGKITVIILNGSASLSSFRVMYLTKVDNPTQEAFDNHSKAWYQEHGKEAVSGQDFNYSVANVKANGGADGNKTTTSTTTTTATTTQTTTSTTVATEPTTTSTTTEETTSTTVGTEPTTTSTTAEETTSTTVETEPTTTSTTTEETTSTTVATEPTTTSTTAEETTVAISTTVGTSTTKQTPSSTGQTRRTLPKTGEEKSFPTDILGFVILVLIGALGIVYRTSENN